MTEDRKRLSQGEQSSLVDMMAIADRSEMILKGQALEKRLAGIKGGTTRLKSSRTNLLKLCTDVLDTVPVDQLEHMKRNLKHVRCHIYVGNAVNQKDTVEGRWFNIPEMNLIASAVRRVCIDCPYETKQEQLQCEYKKLLDKLPVDPDEAGGACGWFTRLGRE